MILPLDRVIDSNGNLSEYNKKVLIFGDLDATPISLNTRNTFE